MPTMTLSSPAFVGRRIHPGAVHLRRRRRVASARLVGSPRPGRPPTRSSSTTRTPAASSTGSRSTCPPTGVRSTRARRGRAGSPRARTTSAGLAGAGRARRRERIATSSSCSRSTDRSGWPASPGGAEVRRALDGHVLASGTARRDVSPGLTRRRGPADRRPTPGRGVRRAGGRSSRTSSIQGRSRPIVVVRPWPGRTPSPVLEPAQPGDRLGHRLGRAAGQVDPAPAAGEQRVAAEQAARRRPRGGRPSPRCGRACGGPRAGARRSGSTRPRPARPPGTDGGISNGAHERLRVDQPLAIERVDGDRRRRCGRPPPRCRRCGPSGRGSRRSA